MNSKLILLFLFCYNFSSFGVNRGDLSDILFDILPNDPAEQLSQEKATELYFLVHHYDNFREEYKQLINNKLKELYPNFSVFKEETRKQIETDLLFLVNLK